MLSQKYNTLSRRFLAILLDGLFLYVLVYLESFFFAKELSPLIIISGLFISYAASHFYSIYLHTVYGQTLGKMIMKIKVLDISENPINFRQSIVRDGIYLVQGLIVFFSEVYQILNYGITEEFGFTNFDTIVLSIFTIILLAEFFVAATNEKRRSIHDFLAGTVVVRLKN